MNVELRKVKICKWASEETTCFQAEIVIDGKAAGSVENDGHGGSNSYYFHDRAVEAAFLAFCAAQPAMECDGTTLPMNEDLYVGELLDRYEEAQQLRRWCRKQTVFRLKGDKTGEYRTVKTLYSHKVKAFLIGKYGDRVEEILNERFAA